MRLWDCLPEVKDETVALFARSEDDIVGVCQKCKMRLWDCLPEVQDEMVGLFARSER